MLVAVLDRPPMLVTGSREEVLELVIVEELDADIVAFDELELPDGSGCIDSITLSRKPEGSVISGK